MRWTILLLAGASALAQTPSSREILDKLCQTYTGVKSFDIAGDVEVTSTGASRPQLAEPFRVVAEYPDKLRIEGSMGAMPRGSASGRAMITDGKITWKFDSRRLLYTRKTGPPEMDFDTSDEEFRQLGIDPASSDAVKLGEMMLVSFRKLSTVADRATVLRTQTVRLGDNQVECYVLETQERPSAAKATWLIDTSRFRIRRMESTETGTTIRMTFYTVSLNEPPPEGVFSFVPPAGARQVDELP